MSILNRPGIAEALEVAAQRALTHGTEKDRLYLLHLVSIEVMRKARDEIRAGNASGADATLSEILNAHDLIVATQTGKGN